jgi:hypothetical protein
MSRRPKRGFQSHVEGGRTVATARAVAPRVDDRRPRRDGAKRRARGRPVEVSADARTGSGRNVLIWRHERAPQSRLCGKPTSWRPWVSSVPKCETKARDKGAAAKSPHRQSAPIVAPFESSWRALPGSSAAWHLDKSGDLRSRERVWLAAAAENTVAYARESRCDDPQRIFYINCAPRQMRTSRWPPR